MSNAYRTARLAAALLFTGLGLGARSQDGVETPTYANVRVVSVDPARRVVVLRTARGVNESFILDDLLAGTGDIKPGDQVIVTLRGGPGQQRVSALTLSRKGRPLPKATPPPTIIIKTGTDPVRPAEAGERYAAIVAALSDEARSIDASWASFVTMCAVKPVSNDGGGREWFGFWDGRVQADYTNGPCRETFNNIVVRGELIKKSMIAAEKDLGKDLNPGEVRAIRTRYSMNWDGWSLPAPPRREP